MVSIELRDIHMCLSRYKLHVFSYRLFNITFAKDTTTKAASIKFESDLHRDVEKFIEFLQCSYRFDLCKISVDDDLLWRIATNLFVIATTAIKLYAGKHPSGKLFVGSTAYFYVCRDNRLHSAYEESHYSTCICDKLLLATNLEEVLGTPLVVPSKRCRKNSKSA